MIEDNAKLIEQLRSDLKPFLPVPGKWNVDDINSKFVFVYHSLSSVAMLVRKQVGNPPDYFDKTFAEYQRGFSANGEL